MKTYYSSTCPAFHDTPFISKAKWAQINSTGATSHRTDRSVLYSQPFPVFNDTKNIVLGKILQEHCDAGGQDIAFTATTNFDGTEVTLAWTAPSGSYPASAGYVIYRNGILLANVPYGTNSYTDTTVVSGQTYTYSMLFHAS